MAERFFDEAADASSFTLPSGHASIARSWRCASDFAGLHFELQAAATDNGIVISLGEQHSFPLEVVFEFVRPENAKYVLTQAMLDAPMFGARWRWNATRPGDLLRRRAQRPPPIQCMRADDLMAAVFPDQAACPKT